LISVFITVTKVSQGIQNPLPSGLVVQVCLLVPYWSNKASTFAGALLYLESGKLAFVLAAGISVQSSRLNRYHI